MQSGDTRVTGHRRDRGVATLQQQTAIYAGLLALALSAPSAGQAQPYYQPYYPPASIPHAYGPPMYGPGVPPQAVMRIVRSIGLTPLSGPVRRGRAYVVMATSRSGDRVRVVVDAMSGDIITVNPRFAMRPNGPPPYGPHDGPGARFGGGVPPVPPYGTPNPPVARVPGDRPPVTSRDPSNARGANTPGRTPVPRPRPENLPSESTSAAPTPTTPPTTPAPASGKPTPAKPTPSPTVPVAPLEL
jgi:hypothetical protein